MEKRIFGSIYGLKVLFLRRYACIYEEMESVTGKKELYRFTILFIIEKKDWRII